MSKLKHPIREAERYLQNARQILSEKAEKEGGYYNDTKYVKIISAARSEAPGLPNLSMTS